LAEPERDDQPLYACGFGHVDGEPYQGLISPATGGE
jgi:hypothetical protein